MPNTRFPLEFVNMSVRYVCWLQIRGVKKEITPLKSFRCNNDFGCVVNNMKKEQINYVQFIGEKLIKIPKGIKMTAATIR